MTAVDMPTDPAVHGAMRDWDDTPLTPVVCEECASRVFVRKKSLEHTQAQWTTSTAHCLELGGADDRWITCSRLRSSIESAVKRGVVPIPNQ